MSEPKEDIDLLSQKELEDGEIEDGELDEPELISTVDNESGLINTDIHDESDVDINDKSSLKFKKHKHHKKGLHRKRHLNSEDKFDSKWKKSKQSNDEDEDEDSSPEITDCKNDKIIDNENYESAIPCNDNEFGVSDNVNSSQKWGDYESDEEISTSNNYNKTDVKQNLYNDSQNKIKNIEIILSPEYEPTNCDSDLPVIKEVVEVSKWNDYDSDNEVSMSSNFNKMDNKRNSFDGPQTSNFKGFKRWDNNYNKNNDNRGWGEKSETIENRYSPVKTQDFLNSESKLDSPRNDKPSWVSYESPDRNNDDVGKNLDNNNSPQRSSIDNFGKWGSYDSPDKTNDDSSKWENKDSPKQDNDSQKWGNRDSPKRNDDYNKWNSRDSPKRNDDDSNKWNSRDNSRRNNFRRWGPRDGSRRNNFRRWGGRDGSQRHNDNQRWGSSNNESPQRNDDNKRWGSYGNSSPQRNNDGNANWGSSYSGSPQRNNDKRWGSSNNGSPQRSGDVSKRWGSPNNASPQRNNDNGSPKMDNEQANTDVNDLPQASKWGAYDSDEETKAPDNNNANSESKMDNDNNNSFQDSPKGNNSISGASKWGAFDSDDETKTPVKENTVSRPNKSSWKSHDSDNETKGSFGENRGKGGYSSGNSWNRNDRNEFKNDRNDFRNDWNDRGDFKNDNRNKRWSNRNDNEKRNVCKYFSMGSCHHGDRCSYLHESPTKPAIQEIKKKELCKFYEHQQCYKRTNCIYMHEEFPCKLFHAGSKMCPSGDSCKYSHAPLNQESKLLLEKYLDEKVDERTDKNGSEWSSIIKKANDDDDVDDDNGAGFDPPEGFYPDQMRYRYPGGQDMMRFPVRPWSAMMRYSDMSMQVPHQMDFMHRQRFLWQNPMNAGRMFPRGFRGMVTPNMHEGFSNGMPYAIPPLIPPNSKLHPANSADIKDNFNVSDPYIDNLAQLVVGKDSSSSPKRLVDMLDPNMQCEDADDMPLEVEINNSKKNLSSPVVIKSPEIPPGAYVPRTSMNVAQPNVRLGPGPAYGGEQAMLYGGYPAHPSESAMMDYINMSAIHYFHNHNEAMGYDVPWKLVLLEVPVKIPYPLMVIETQDLPHKYTDPRLKGHPSVLNASNTNEESMMHQNSYDFNSISTFGSQLSSPSFITPSSESSETLTPLNDFLPKSDEPESPMFPIGDEIFSFKHKLETDDYTKKVSDNRSYLQDPRFKRKKVIVNAAMDSSEME